MKASDIRNLARKNILNLQPYSSARQEFTDSEGVLLDANENPFGNLNRYPDPVQRAVKEKLSRITSVPVKHIFIGNGSDEVIDLAFRIFCEPGKDKALIFTPTYGMYEVAAAINGVEMIRVPLDHSFQINFDTLPSVIADEQIKMIILCSPNNPTGNIIENIDSLLPAFRGIVLVDEAYIDFSGRESLLNRIPEYPNLIVSQTLSKSRGLAAARVGIAYAGEEVISLFNKVKPPYNVSGPNQQAALNALDDSEGFKEQVRLILRERKQLMQELLKLEAVVKVYPSDANFLLVEMQDAGVAYAELLKRNIITRNRSGLVKNCLRITIGTPAENQLLLEALTDLKT